MATSKRLLQTAVHRIGPAICEPLDRRVLMAAGDPDPAFNFGGVSVIQFPGTPFVIRDVAIQSTGKIVAVGSKGGNLAVARLNANGSLDTSFGSNGLFESPARPDVTAVAIQPDDKIILALTGTLLNGDNTVGRLFKDGGFDPSFGSGGISVDLNRSIRDLSVQQDGKIVAVGGTFGDGDFNVVRLTDLGMLDNTFDGDGRASVGFGANEEAWAVAIDYNGTPATNPYYGTIVVAGDKGDPGAPSGNFAICRFLPTGTLDGTFDGDGKLTSPNLSPQPGELARGVHIQPGGKIIVAGTALAIAGDIEVGDFLAARYFSDGQLDPSFGPNGTGVVQSDFGGDERAADLAPSHAGGFFVSGIGGSSGIVAAYTANGNLDPRFSGDGLMRSSIYGAVHIETTLDTISPIRRLVIGIGSQVGRYIDIGPTITLGSFNTVTSEASGATRSVIVARTVATPTPQRVYINIAGTATAPILSHPDHWDYTLTGMTIVGFNNDRNYVDIPANQTFTTFSITPINDTRPEGDETIDFSISSDPTYDTDQPSSTTMLIRDDDVTTGPVVVSAQFFFETGPQRLQFRFSQDVGGSISAGDFQLTGPPGIPSQSFSYDDTTNTATLSFNGRLPNGNHTATAIATGITNSSGQPLGADYVLPFFSLNGDANRDRAVDISDLAILATNWQLSPRTFSQADFNYDGTVDISDLAILATNWQASLPVAVEPLATRSLAAASNGATRRPSRMSELILE